MLNTLMNVRQQSGRRRGRGGQNRQGGGGRGPESGNRIDNRARGNAPQLLEKYKGLARDAQQAGDRVLMEYYLQFADHYFRVVMESRTRTDEQRQPRGDGDQGQDDGDEGQDGQDDGEDDFGFKLPPRQDQRPQRQERDDRGSREDRGQREDRPREDRPRSSGSSPGQVDQPREDRARQEPRPREDRPYNGNGNSEQLQRGPQQPRFAEEPEEAPRRRELPPRRDRGARAEDGGPASFDTSVLPPAIGNGVSESSSDGFGGLPMGVEGEPIDLPAPKKRGRPRKVTGATPDGDA